ncbi:MAG: ABC transporter permease [Gammaproteobacteria bacterium]|nr:ABC transporter permease [Gammaproteobacteria bacterium]MDH3464356.1 ABC transporter permease [Gammaproteobacteria bacterium]
MKLPQQARASVGVCVILLAWHLSTSKNNVLTPPLNDVLWSFLELLRSRILLKDAFASLFRVLAGVAISSLLAAVLGLVAVYWRSFPDYLSGGIELFRPIPPIAWTPLAIVAFGVGTQPAIAIVALGAFFPIWLGIQQGLMEVKRSHILAAESFGCGKLLQLTDVIVPSALPYAFHGLRLGVGLGWFCVVAAEMMGASSGLGYGIQLFSLNIEMEKLYSYLLVIGMLGYVSNFLLQRIDLRLSHWRDDG